MQTTTHKLICSWSIHLFSSQPSHPLGRREPHPRLFLLPFAHLPSPFPSPPLTAPFNPSLPTPEAGNLQAGATASHSRQSRSSSSNLHKRQLPHSHRSFRNTHYTSFLSQHSGVLLLSVPPLLSFTLRFLFILIRGSSLVEVHWKEDI